MAPDSFTPTQAKMLAVLADGQPHTRAELHACLVDELGPGSNIRPHLSAIRKKLRPIGQDIICEAVNYKYFYRHIRLLAPVKSG